MYESRQPITKAYIEAAMALPLPHVSNPGANPRIMSAVIMGDWMLAHPGCTIDDLRAEFSSVELTKFLGPARDYAIRKSGGVH